MTPGARPLNVLAAQLVSLAPPRSRCSRPWTGWPPTSAAWTSPASLAVAERPADERIVLAVDQFEEIFTLCADDAEQAAFVANLCYAATIPGGPAGRAGGNAGRLLPPLRRLSAAADADGRPAVPRGPAWC
ncbi:MAG: hypothetical protein ACRD0K_03580 [Egibacteraceae bacterium]